jgi:hypothetical protein
MPNLSVTQCVRHLNFEPRRLWPEALPAIAWRGELISGFERKSGAAVDVYETNRSGLIETLKAVYPELGLAETARLSLRLAVTMPETWAELREGFFRAYNLRWNDRLGELLNLVASAPAAFQSWVDEKSVSPRDLSPLLALNENLRAFHPFLEAMTELRFSRNEGVRALELGAELFLMGRPLSDLLPSTADAQKYLRQLELWRRPVSLENDQEWRADVQKWPWPAQVQGEWQRFGDQSGLEVKIRATSAEDFNKKLERLLSIGDTWSSKS